MKLKEKVRLVNFPVYSYRINIVISNDIIGSRSKRSKELGSEYSASLDDKYVTGMHSYRDGEFESFIFMKLPLIPDTVAHECFHAVSRMFKSKGEFTPGEEVMAYTLGYLVGEVYKVK